MPEDRVRELVDFAAATLPSMRRSDGLFCHEMVAPGERRSGGRLGRGAAVSDAEAMSPLGRSPRYSLMVAVGLHRRPVAGLDPHETRSLAEREITGGATSIGDLGLLAWEGARSGQGAGAEVVHGLRARLPSEGGGAEGHELAWVAIGCAEAAREGTDPGLEPVAAKAGELLLERASTPSRLLRQSGRGARSRFPHFATQIYGLLALTKLAETRENDRHEAAARGLADALIRLQREDGAWPWIYDTERGTVVEPYRLYSVHQDAMAPMALIPLARMTGEESYRQAALRGLDWIWANESGRSMLDHDAGMVYRSLNRSGLRDRGLVWANTIIARFGGRPLGEHTKSLEVERTDRPYHLGWVLEAWGAEAPSAS